MLARPRFSKLALLLGSSLVGLLLSEGLCRWWLRASGVPWSREQAVTRYGDWKAQVLGELDWQIAPSSNNQVGNGRRGSKWELSPYFGFDVESTGRAMRNHRSAQESADESDVSILIVGGSVAANFSFHGRERLFEQLQQDPRFADKNLRVMGYARSAHKQPQQLFRVGYLLAMGYEMDVVVNLDGFNEVAVATMNAEHGLHPSLPAAAQWLPIQSTRTQDSQTLRLSAIAYAHQEKLIRSIEGWQSSLLLESAIVDRVVESHLARKMAEYQKAASDFVVSEGRQSAQGAGWNPEYATDESERLTQCVELWEESSVALHGQCAAHGIQYVHVLQPTLHDAGSKPLSAQELDSSAVTELMIRATRDGYPLLRAAGERLRARGVAFHDGSAVFREFHETIYFDACHFRKPGHELLADFIAAAILARED